MDSLTVRVSLSVDVDLEAWHREHEPESNTHRLRQEIKAHLLEHVERLDEVTEARLVNGPHR